MSRARDLARLQPNSSGVLPTANLNSSGYVTPKLYHGTRSGGGISTSQTAVSFTIQITNSVNKTIIVASDLLRVSSGYIRGSLQIDGSNVETEYMYLQGTTNNWTTITGIYTANNLSVGTHTISLYADFTTGAGAWDGPTYVQATVWDGPSV